MDHHDLAGRPDTLGYDCLSSSLRPLAMQCEVSFQTEVGVANKLVLGGQAVKLLNQ